MDKDNKNNLFVDNLIEVNEPIPEEILKTILFPKGKIVCEIGAGIFNIKDFEKVSRRLDELENV